VGLSVLYGGAAGAREVKGAVWPGLTTAEAAAWGTKSFGLEAFRGDCREKVGPVF